jgi:hypothetical protein
MLTIVEFSVVSYWLDPSFTNEDEATERRQFFLVLVETSSSSLKTMDIATIGNDYLLILVADEHDWIHLLCIGISTVFSLIEVFQRLSIDMGFDSSKFPSSALIFVQKNRTFSCRRSSSRHSYPVAQSLFHEFHSTTDEYFHRLVHRLCLASKPTRCFDVPWTNFYVRLNRLENLFSNRNIPSLVIGSLLLSVDMCDE